jgi:hypothetical protein
MERCKTHKMMDWPEKFLTGSKDSLLGWILESMIIILFVQNYLASFGLCPSSGMWKFYKRPQRFGDWIYLRPQVDEIETSSFWRAQLSRSTLPHPPEDGDTSSLRNVVVFCKTSTYQTMDRVQKSQIVLYNIHHHQNPFKSILFVIIATLTTVTMITSVIRTVISDLKFPQRWLWWDHIVLGVGTNVSE